MQYSRRLRRELNLTLGVVYGLPQTIRMEKTKTITESSSEYSYNMKRVSQTLPQYVGGGVSVEYKKMTYALDYLFRQYGSLTSADSRVTFHDSHELRAGICYFPDGYSSSGIWKRMAYKVGVVPFLHADPRTIRSLLARQCRVGLPFDERPAPHVFLLRSCRSGRPDAEARDNGL